MPVGSAPLPGFFLGRRGGGVGTGVAVACAQSVQGFRVGVVSLYGLCLPVMAEGGAVVGVAVAVAVAVGEVAHGDGVATCGGAAVPVLGEAVVFGFGGDLAEPVLCVAFALRGGFFPPVARPVGDGVGLCLSVLGEQAERGLRTGVFLSGGFAVPGAGGAGSSGTPAPKA